MVNVPEEIKDLLHLDSWKKNIRIHFPDGERADICNDQIVMDSVQFTESICSQNTLKFGLCESPIFQCEVIGVSNVTGANIEVYCEVYCDDTVDGAVWQNDLEHYVYQIPYGTFIVQSAKRQADMIHRKIVAYSYLYHALSYEVTEYNSLSAFYACTIVNSSANYSTNIEWMIYGSFPYLFNEKQYNYNTFTFPDRARDYGNTSVATLSNFFKKDNIYYDLVITSGRFHIASSSTNLYVYNFENEDTPENILQKLRTVSDNFAIAFPNVIVDNKPFVLYDYIISHYKSLLKSTFRALRWDYINSQLSGQMDFLVKKGKVVTCPGVVEAYLYGCFSIVVVKHAYDPDYPIFEGNINLLKPDAFAYSIPSSEFDWLSWSLKRKKDSHPYGSYTASGYSARKSFFEVDLFKLINALGELAGVFWDITRDGAKIINIKQNFGMTPSDTLFPSESLHPEGVNGGKLLPQDYQSCWYDDEYEKPYGAIQVLYENSNNVDCLFTLYLDGYDEDSPVDSYKIYSIKGNYIIDSYTWTQSQISAICNRLAPNISGVTYMPVEFVGRGLPYVEAGDTFEILTKSNDSITTIVLNRTIKGEQHLVDSYKSV